MFKQTRALSAIVGLICAVALLTVGATAATGKAKPKKKGKADSGTSYVAITHTTGGFDYAAGNTTDKLFGATAVTYKLKAAPATPGTVAVTAKPVVLYTSTGTLVGTGSATLTVDSKGNATVTNGKLSLTRGTGALKGHSLVATFTGTGSAVTGLYTFHYKGTYK
jgi:hypothetical protein